MKICEWTATKRNGPVNETKLHLYFTREIRFMQGPEQKKMRGIQKFRRFCEIFQFCGLAECCVNAKRHRSCPPLNLFENQVKSNHSCLFTKI